MSGLKFLLDTNIIIGILKQNKTAMDLIHSKRANMQNCAYSFVTRIELLSFPDISSTEINMIQEILDELHYLGCTTSIEDAAIAIRKKYRFKLPDAIISATSRAHSLELLSLDQNLMKNH